jgi:hypothetical protein
LVTPAKPIPNSRARLIASSTASAHAGKRETAACVDQDCAAFRAQDSWPRRSIAPSIGEMRRVLRHTRNAVRGEPVRVGMKQRPRGRVRHGSVRARARKRRRCEVAEGFE